MDLHWRDQHTVLPLAPEKQDTVIWFFERDDQTLRVETRYATDTAEYLLVICWPEGDECERFTSVAGFHARLVQIENRLEEKRWSRVRRLVIVPNERPRRS